MDRALPLVYGTIYPEWVLSEGWEAGMPGYEERRRLEDEHLQQLTTELERREEPSQEERSQQQQRLLQQFEERRRYGQHHFTAELPDLLPIHWEGQRREQLLHAQRQQQEAVRRDEQLRLEQRQEQDRREAQRREQLLQQQRQQGEMHQQHQQQLQNRLQQISSELTGIYERQARGPLQPEEYTRMHNLHQENQQLQTLTTRLRIQETHYPNLPMHCSMCGTPCNSSLRTSDGFPICDDCNSRVWAYPMYRYN